MQFKLNVDEAIFQGILRFLIHKDLGILSVSRFKDQIIRILGNPIDIHGKNENSESYFYSGFTLYFENNMLNGVSIKRLYLYRDSKNDFKKVGISEAVLKVIFLLSVLHIKELCIENNIEILRKVYPSAPDELNLVVNKNFSFCFDENNEIELIEFIFEDSKSDLYYLESY
jgi:hypothetical protein